MVTQQAKLIGMLEQSQHPIADHIDSRLVPGVEQQHAGRDQFVLGQHLARFLDRRQRADQIILRIVQPLARQIAQIVGELGGPCTARAACASVWLSSYMATIAADQGRR